MLPTSNPVCRTRGFRSWNEGYMRRVALLPVAAALALVPLTAAHAAVPARYANCDAVHRTSPHGIGRAGAVDRVRSGPRVTVFRRDTAGYLLAVRANARLDGDRDGIACEKR